MNTRITLAATLSGFALAAFAAPDDRLEFAPEEGSTLTKTFTTTGSFALDDFSMTMNGEEFDPAMMGAEVDLDDISVEGSFTLVVTDEYIGVSDGQPTELLRTYDSLSAEFEAGTGESGAEDAEEIEGAVVRFKWNDDEGAYDRVLEEGGEDAEEEDLAMLAEDLDLRALLPSRAVSADATWTVDSDELGALLLPGVDVSAAQERMMEEMGEEIPIDMSEYVDGMFEEMAITCTYAGMRDVDGTEVAVIELASELEGSFDLTDILMAAIEEEMGDVGMEMDIAIVIDYAMELEGELLWNAAAGHAHSMQFDAETAVDLVGEMYMDMMGEEMDMTFNAEMSGEISREVTVE